MECMRVEHFLKSKHALFFLSTCTLLANEKIAFKLNNDSTITFLETPKEVDNLVEVLTKGEFYGRFRFNSFSFDWDEEIDGKRGDHQTLGVGGSLHYKSAYFHAYSWI